MTYVVGISGSIATGKSSVSAYIKSKGYTVVDSDLIVRKLNSEGGPGDLLIKKHFPEVIKFDKIDTKALANIIFKNKEKRELLNSLIHPLVKEEILKEIKRSTEDFIFIDVPLLYESGFDTLCDLTVVVYTSYDIELKRLIKRDGIEEELAQSKILSQLDIEIKKEKADFVIDNSFKLKNTYLQVDKLIEKIKENINGTSATNIRKSH